MKNSLFILLVLLLSACAVSTDIALQNEYVTKAIPDIFNLEDNEQFVYGRNGVLYLDSLPYSGYLIAIDLNGTRLSQRGFVNGIQEGDWLTFYGDGSQKSVRPYLHGEKHGDHLGYFPDGQLQFHYYFENGLSQDVHFTWYENGQLASETNYVDGQELGSQKAWRKDGKMRSNYVVKENGRRYGMVGLKRCAKIDSETQYIDPYTGTLK